MPVRRAIRVRLNKNECLGAYSLQKCPFYWVVNDTKGY
jgi:hypothetical protein